MQLCKYKWSKLTGKKVLNVQTADSSNQWHFNELQRAGYNQELAGKSYPMISEQSEERLLGDGPVRVMWNLSHATYLNCKRLIE